jgi:3-hydroxyacyl-[acyl-carrier-protein] dehydratase
VLIFHDNALPGKVAIFLGIDRAKFRRTVVPGDQLILEAEMTQMRRNACKVRACAKIGDSIVAEADMMFGLMDSPSTQDKSATAPGNAAAG